jgi:tetratricopeptide (TPR) repeat protein
LGDFGKWEGMSKRVLEIYMSCIVQNQQTLALVIGGMGSRYAALGRFDEAKGCLKEALTICDSEPDLRTTLAPGFLSDAASIAIRRGEFVRARRLIARATELLEQAPAQDKRLQLSILIDSVWLLQVTGDINEFARVSLQAETVAKEVCESDPAGAVTSTIILIHCNQELGRAKDATRLTQWLAGKLRDVAHEAGVDVLDRFMDQGRPCYGSKGIPSNLEEIVERIKAEQKSPTLP